MTNHLAVIQRKNVIDILNEFGVLGFKAVKEATGLSNQTLLNSFGPSAKTSPSPKTMRLLADYCNVSVNELNKADCDISGAHPSPKSEPQSSDVTIIRMARVTVVSEDGGFEVAIKMPLSDAKKLLAKALFDDT